MAKVRKAPSRKNRFESLSYQKSRFDCRIEAVTDRKSDARASRRVGRYSIAPQGSLTAGVTRPFARTAQLGLSLAQPKLALLSERSSKFANANHVTHSLCSISYVHVEEQILRCFKIIFRK